jgi:gamma-glutamyltranspeptidase/glutathione hydrolase
VLTNPPPSAGGTLLAYALALLDRGPAPPTLRGVVDAMAAAQSERTPQFVEGLPEEGFLERFLTTRLGSTTHISVLDGQGRACSVTCTNGEGSGEVVPGTGMHINNVMGEQDLNPLGFHHYPAGRRMPSMMAPSIVMRDGEVELVLGSAGSNRIRSALLQTIVAVVDHGMRAREAVDAPRVHFEDSILFAEPGIDLAQLYGSDVRVVRFGALNLFFGGVQAVQRRGDTLTGAGDPRRGGAAVSA